MKKNEKQASPQAAEAAGLSQGVLFASAGAWLRGLPAGLFPPVPSHWRSAGRRAGVSEAPGSGAVGQASREAVLSSGEDRASPAIAAPPQSGFRTHFTSLDDQGSVYPAEGGGVPATQAVLPSRSNAASGRVGCGGWAARPAAPSSTPPPLCLTGPPSQGPW